MAVIDFTSSPTGTTKSMVVSWVNLTSGDTGNPVSFSQYTDRSVQAVGTFGGATVVIEGTIDGTNWSTLTDPQGNDLLFTAAKIEMVTEATLRVRPRIQGGAGTQVSVHMLLKE